MMRGCASRDVPRGVESVLPRVSVRGVESGLTGIGGNRGARMTSSAQLLVLDSVLGVPDGQVDLKMELGKLKEVYKDVFVTELPLGLPPVHQVFHAVELRAGA